jgi:hypothetical protein
LAAALSGHDMRVNEHYFALRAKVVPESLVTTEIPNERLRENPLQRLFKLIAWERETALEVALDKLGDAVNGLVAKTKFE